MPLQKLQFKPGINREGTNYSNEGGWYDCDKIRFRSGNPEKIGGWTQQSPNQYLGVARALWGWVDLSGNNFLGIGTNLKYYIEKGADFFDVTPIITTSTLVNKCSTAFSTLNGTITATATSLVLTSAASFPSTGGIIRIDSETISYTGKSSNTLTGLVRGVNSTTAASHTTGANVGAYTVTISDVSYNPYAGDYLTITGGTPFGGITLSGEYVVSGVPSGSTYTITAATFATSLATASGGTIVVAYQIPVGTNVATFGTGWGTGPWSRGSWGSGYTSVLSSQLRLWSNDNYGQNLFIAPRTGAVYYWLATNGVASRAQPLDTLATAAGKDGTYVPNNVLQVLTAPIQQFVICMGSNPYISGSPNSTFNPLLVRWSDQADEYEWVPAVTNQSGEFALSNGSEIIGARTTRQEILIWTDTALYSMQYLGAPYVWGFQILMDNLSIMSPNAMVTVNNVTYWMGRDKFYMYTGRVETLPCTVRQYIFQDVNIDQNYQIFAASNEGYNEVWWFYVSNDVQDSTLIDKYVIYNYLDQVWYFGSMARTAWLDSSLQPYPVAADYNSRLLYHESGVNDNSTAATLPIDAYIQSSDFDIGDGHNFGFVWRILPDLNFNGSNVSSPSVTMTVKPRVNSGTAYGPADNPKVQSSNVYSNTQNFYNIQEFTGQVYTRIRGRQMAFRIESDTVGVAWQLGAPRIDIRPDGRR
jgi:hypothetical protein